ncbi:hypothetical protein Anapl_17889 [Anas platyrhynchos]|uniref:Chemokine interleukin-8-like domain-containing protein n=1 Tax=Anas platyrhynchos TaxID=8839 RepID=R0L0H4_ANAPL|nr:hypothetical protein Anapl_17889 [Anas platyrhynchos]
MLSTRPVLLLLLLLTFSQHCATALYTPTECCFDYAQKPVRIANIKSFYTTSNDCALPAVVSVTYAAGGALLTKFWLSELQDCRVPLVLEQQKGLSSTLHVSPPSLTTFCRSS